MFNYIPYTYSELNLVEGTFTPSEYKKHDNYTFYFFVRSLFQRACSTLDFHLPDNWSAEAKDFFYYCLFKYGFVVVFKPNDKLGVIFQPCTLNGFDLYYQPTEALVTNPALSNLTTLKIHKNCELIKLSPDYLGVWDIIDYYATKLSNMSCALDMTIENSKVAFVFAGKTKSARETIKKIFDKISRGVSCIATDSTVTSPDDVEPFSWLTRNAKDSYIGQTLLQDMQTIINNFDREIGIPTIPYEKKERMVDFESKSAILDAGSRLSVWQKTLEESISNVNTMFDLNITFDTRIDDLEDILHTSDISDFEGGVENEP